MNNNNVGIVGYGAYIPGYYMDSEGLSWGARILGLRKKALAVWDEDSVTMAVEAGRRAMRVAGVGAEELGAVYVGSESPPYAVNPMSTIVADVLKAGSAIEGGLKEYRAVDLQFACKAATAGLQMAMGEVQSGSHDWALVVGADKAQARPGDVLEWSAGAAAAALVVGRERMMAKVLVQVSVTSDMPDFWRREGQKYPKHAGRFSGKPAYFDHVLAASRMALERAKVGVGDLAYGVFHMPNGVFPVEVARKLGLSEEQYGRTLTVEEVGNPYAAATLLGLVAGLERLKPGEKMLVTAYGSGAGADSMVLEGTEELNKMRRERMKAWFGGRKQVRLADYKMRERWE